MPKIDYLVVGAGLFGATFAQQAIEAGKTVLVIDRQPHVAGNCHTEEQDGILVHRYGPHIFHTSSDRIWRYVNRFAEFNNYRHIVQARTVRGVLSVPINLSTLAALYGITTPADAQQYFADVREQVDGDNAEAHCLRTIGHDLYALFIRDYTAKQWQRHPRDLPASIVKRLPVRLTWDNRYFSDRWEGIPVGGYTRMVERMLVGADVLLGVDFLVQPGEMRKLARKVVYSGPIDALFDYDLGRLAYRSVRFEFERHDTPDLLGIAQMNCPAPDVPWTRLSEPKHFAPVDVPHTIICREYPTGDGEPAYPIADRANVTLAARYQQRAEQEGYLVGGRLGRYQYLDMHQAIGQALMLAERELT